MPSPTCDELSIPEQLRCNSRQSLAFETATERLFRWFPPELESEPDGTLSLASISSAFSPPSDISCNRESLCSHPTDVLYNSEKHPHRFDFGVIRAVIGEIVAVTHAYEEKDGFNNRTTRTITFEVEHTPEICMYPHSEIRVFRDAVMLQGDIKPKAAKIAVREALQPLFIVCHHPDPQFNPTESTTPSSSKGKKSVSRIRNFFRRLFTSNLLSSPN